MRPSLEYFSIRAQSETSEWTGGAAAVEAGIDARQWCSASNRRDLISVLCDGNVGNIEERLRKRKLKHDFTFIICHLDDRPHKSVDAFGFQQFPDHGAGDFPRAIRIPQLLAFGVGDQFIADSGIEEISRHGSKPVAVAVTGPGAAWFSQVLYLKFAAAGRTNLGIPNARNMNLLIHHWFGARLQKPVNSFSHCSIKAAGF
jgi:hypothetical protein